MIWLAGRLRWATESSLIGFHAVYDAKTKQEIGKPNGILALRYKDWGLDEDAITFLLTADPDRAIYLTQESAQKYHIAHEGVLPSEASIQLFLQALLNEQQQEQSSLPESRSGPFDGRWSATVGPQGGCKFTSTLILDVLGSSIVGNATNPSGVFPLTGTVDLSGTGVFKIGKFVGTIKFSGTTFEANYANDCGGRFAIGAKRTAAH